MNEEKLTRYSAVICGVFGRNRTIHRDKRDLRTVSPNEDDTLPQWYEESAKKVAQEVRLRRGYVKIVRANITQVDHGDGVLSILWSPFDDELLHKYEV